MVALIDSKEGLIGMFHLRNVCAKRESDTRLPKIILLRNSGAVSHLCTLHNEKFAKELNDAHKTLSHKFPAKKNHETS